MNVGIDALEELLRLLRKESRRKSGATMTLSEFINDTAEGRDWYVACVTEEFKRKKKKKKGEEEED